MLVSDGFPWKGSTGLEMEGKETCSVCHGHILISLYGGPGKINHQL